MSSGPNPLLELKELHKKLNRGELDRAGFERRKRELLSEAVRLARGVPEPAAAAAPEIAEGAVWKDSAVQEQSDPGSPPATPLFPPSSQPAPPRYSPAVAPRSESNRIPLAPVSQAPRELGPSAEDGPGPPPPKKGSSFPVWFLPLGAALILAGLGWTWWMLAGSPLAKGREAIRKGRIFAPPGACAVDVFEQLYAEAPGGRGTRELGRLLGAPLKAEGEGAFNRFYRESAQDLDWDHLERLYDVLSRAEPESRETLARHAYCRAHKAFERRDYAAALAGYRESLNQQPRWALALNGIAKVYVREDSPYHDDARAVALYQQAYEADPNFVFPIINLARHYMNEREWATAETYLRAAIKADSDRASILKDLGITLKMLRRYAEALPYYEQARRLETDPRAIQVIDRELTVVRARAAVSNYGSGEPAAAGQSDPAEHGAALGACYMDANCYAGNQYAARDYATGSCVPMSACRSIWKCRAGALAGSCGGGETLCTLSPGCGDGVQSCSPGYCTSLSSCSDRIGFSNDPVCDSA